MGVLLSKVMSRPTPPGLQALRALLLPKYLRKLTVTRRFGMERFIFEGPDIWRMKCCWWLERTNIGGLVC